MPQNPEIAARWPLGTLGPLLRGSGFWPRSISDASVAALVSSGHFEHFAKGRRIATRTERSLSMHMVLAGSIRILMQSSDGQEFLIAFIGPGNFCELLPCLDGQPSAYDIYAHSESDVLTIEAADLRALMKSNLEIQDAIVQILCLRLRLSFDGIEQFAVWSPRARLAARLLGLVKSHGSRHPDGTEIEAHFGQEVLAAMVGLSRQRTNKILREFEDAGILSLAYRHIVVRDTDRLRDELRNQDD